MQVITRESGDPFADEVAHWVGQGLRIVETGPNHVVLSPPAPAPQRNRGHWRLAKARRPRRRSVTITMGPIGASGLRATWG